MAPSRSGSTPNASSSASVIPPSGPTTMTMSPLSGASTDDSGAAADSCSTTGSAASAMSATTSRVEARSRTSGMRSRRACFAASRAVERHRVSALSARSPRSCTTHRDADQGTITSAPTSVSSSTASSPRSPLGSACTTTIRGTAGGSTTAASGDTSTASFETATTRPRMPEPIPSATTICSPTSIRRTTAAWCASGPVSRTTEPLMSP